MRGIGHVTCAAVVLLARVAYADPATADSARDPATGPAFVNLERFDATSRAGMELMVLSPFDLSDRRRWEVFGQWIEPTHRIGGYLRLPYMTEEFIDIDTVIHSSGFGNLSLGAIWFLRSSTPGMAIVFHAGIGVPSGADLDGPGFRLTRGRPHDLFSTFTHQLTAEGGTSLLYAGKYAFGRIDAGIDVTVLTWDIYVEPRKLAFHANAGAGVRLGPLSVAGELSTLTGSDDLHAALALSVRVRTRWVEPYAAYILPRPENQGHWTNRAVLVGIEAVLP